MPRRELRRGSQVDEWLRNLSKILTKPGRMTLIGSAALLWQAHEQGIDTELPDASMDADPTTDSDEIAMACYDCLIGSEFEKKHGWHVNLMPGTVIEELPAGWKARATVRKYGLLTLTVPHADDLIASKLKRGEPRDIRHYRWARKVGLVTIEKGVRR